MATYKYLVLCPFVETEGSGIQNDTPICIMYANSTHEAMLQVDMVMQTGILPKDDADSYHYIDISNIQEFGLGGQPDVNKSRPRRT